MQLNQNLNNDDRLFLQSVMERVRNKPELGNWVISAVTDAYTARIREEATRASDMEMVASMALHSRLFNGNEGFIHDKVEPYHKAGHTSINWTTTLEMLKSKFQVKLSKTK